MSQLQLSSTCLVDYSKLIVGKNRQKRKKKNANTTKLNCKLWVFVVQKQRATQTTHFRCMSFLRLANQKISIVCRLLYSLKHKHRGRHTSRDSNGGKLFVCISIFIWTTSCRTIFLWLFFFFVVFLFKLKRYTSLNLRQ